MPFERNLIIAMPVVMAALVIPTAVFAQNSIIDQIQKSQAAIVTVKAENVGVHSSKPAVAGIDRHTGRMMIVRNVKTA